MTIDDGWAPVIVSPENMSIRFLVDIFRNGNLADVQATVLRHIVTHHSTESLIRNIRKQKIDPISTLKLLSGDSWNDCMEKMESLCQRGPFVFTTVRPQSKDMSILHPISIKFCELKIPNILPHRRAHISLPEDFVNYLRKGGLRYTNEEVAEIVSSRLCLVDTIYPLVATGTESDRDMISLLKQKNPVVSVNDEFYISGDPVALDALVEISDDALTPACYESLAIALSRLLRDHEFQVPPVGYTIEEAVFNVIVGSCSHFEATVEYIAAHGILSKGPQLEKLFRVSDRSLASCLPAGVIDTLIQGLQFDEGESFQMHFQSVEWSGENSLIEVFVEHRAFPGRWCKLEIRKGKISILRKLPSFPIVGIFQNSLHLLREATLQLQGIDISLNFLGCLLKLGTLHYLNQLSPYALPHASPSSFSAMNCLTEVLSVLSRTWKAFTDELHNFEPSLENMGSARKYRGLDADILKGFELTVIDWDKIAIAGSESTDDVRNNMVCLETVRQIFEGELRLDELYTDTMLSLVDDKDFKFIRHEEKCIDALWVSNYYGLGQMEVLFPELHKASSVFFDTIDNYYVSVPTLKKLLVIYKDPGTDINLKESLFKQKTGSAAGETSRLVFLELASAIRPSSGDPSKVSISEAIRRRNIADAVEGIIFKYGKVEEKIRENLHRDVSLWKRSRLKKSDIMRKVEETTRGILAREDLAWLERELVATWGKMGMVKIPQLCSEESSEHEQYYQFAKPHGSDRQRIMHYITMDTPVPAAGVVVIEDSNDGETLVCAGGVDLEKSGSYLGAPLYRMKDGKSRRRKRKSQQAKKWEVGYIE